MALIRLDRFLADCGKGTRSEVKLLVKKGMVTISGEVCRDTSLKLDPDTAVVCVNGERLNPTGLVYIMLNKPKGYISATTDATQPTVTQLIDTSGIRGDVFPVGRLDIDTTGLLILTNDGDFAHRTLSPRKHVDKKYIATVTGELTESAITAFADGIRLSDTVCAPAKLRILASEGEFSTAEVTIHEGKFHQVKRMFGAVGCRVTELKRISFGEIELDPQLAEGESRPLNNSELEFVARVKNG